MKLIRIIMLASILAACAPDDSPPTQRIQADFGRVGPIKVGMSQQEISLATGIAFSDDAVIPPDEELCYYLETQDALPGVYLMMNQDQLVRYDIRNTTIRTSEGVGIGSTREEVTAAYGLKLVVEPHKYTDGSYYIVEGDDQLKLLFEINNGVVATYRSGRDPAVRYVEGCL